MNPDWVIEEIRHHDSVAWEYDKLYYDPITFKLLGREVSRDLRQRLGLENRAQVLDLGSGTGSTALPLNEYFEVHALDISKRMLLRLKQKADLSLILASAEDLPFRSEVFDAVVISKTLHHLPPPLLPMVMTEANRVLRKKGIIYIVEDSALNQSLLQIERSLARVTAPQIYPSGKQSHTENEYTLTHTKLNNLLAQNGFDIELIETTHFYPWKIIQRLPPELASGLWGIPKKIPLLRRMGAAVKIAGIKNN